MKIKYLILVCSILCLLLSPASVLAESENPPPKKTKEPSIETQQAEPIQTEPQIPTLSTNTTFPTPPEKEIIDTSSRMSSDREISVVDSFDIGVLSGVSERHSDVAHSDNVYVVAYEEDGAIVTAKIIDYGGSVAIYWNTIYDGDESSYFPSIAYEAGTGLFVITWQYDFSGNGSDYDIYARALNPWSGPVGSAVTVASSYDQETRPDIACNPYDESCLIVFNFDDGDENIYGRYMDITSSGVSDSSPSLVEITDIDRSTGPHVAWSNYGSSYLVAYTWTDNIDGETFPVASVLYDTYQGSSSASIMADEWPAVGIGADPWYDDLHDKSTTGVAYDFCSEKFIIVYTYDFFGDGTDYDIHASATNSDGANLYGPFTIAGSSAQETGADISFIADPIPAIANDAPCKFVTAFSRSGHSSGIDGIMTTEIKGNCSYSSPDYTTPPSSEHILVAEPSGPFGSGVLSPAIIGGNDSEFFVSYDDVTGGFVYQYSVLGKLFRSGLYNFLPLIIR